MAKGIEEVAALPDPVGRVLKRVERPNGLVIEKTAVPMGCLLYTSRPLCAAHPLRIQKEGKDLCK